MQEKRVKGRKRNLVVNTMGLVIALIVTVAGVQHRDAAAAVVANACPKAPRLQKHLTDGAYGGKRTGDIEMLHLVRVEVVRRPGNRTTGTLHETKLADAQANNTNPGFMVLPKS